MKTIGERIVFLREQRHISQKELAAQIGITAASLSRYENNIYDPKGSILIALATILKSSTDFILGLTPDYSKNREMLSKLDSEDLFLLNKYKKLNHDDQIRIAERIDVLLEERIDVLLEQY